MVTDKEKERFYDLIHKLEERYGSITSVPIRNQDLNTLWRLVGNTKEDIMKYIERKEVNLAATKKKKAGKRKAKVSHHYKPGDTVTDGWKTYAFDKQLNLRLISYGSHATYKISKKELKELRGMILGNAELI